MEDKGRWVPQAKARAIERWKAAGVRPFEFLEIEQEALLALWNAAQKTDGRGGFAKYASRRIIWALREWLRNRNAEIRLSAKARNDTDAEADLRAPEPDTESREEARRLARRVLSFLPRCRERYILAAIYLRGGSRASVAEKLRISATRVRQLELRGLEKLRAMLPDDWSSRQKRKEST